MDKILLFIPCYNCENQITKVLDSLKQYDCLSEIIVVDNGSKDSTVEKAIEFAEKNVEMPVSVMKNRQNYNLGGSHKVAFQYAADNKFDYVIVLHGDNQGDINDIKEILENKTYKNFDCCLGARFMKGAKLINYAATKIMGNIAFNVLFSLCLFRKIYDLGGGLNIYKTEMLKDKFYLKYPDALSFNYVMTTALDFYDQKYMYFPLTWKEDGQVSNVNVVKQGFELLGMLFKYIFNKKRFINSEFRKMPFEEYASDKVYSNLK